MINSDGAIRNTARDFELTENGLEFRSTGGFLTAQTIRFIHDALEQSKLSIGYSTTNDLARILSSNGADLLIESADELELKSAGALKLTVGSILEVDGASGATQIFEVTTPTGTKTLTFTHGILTQVS